ncbi:glycosyl hydrolase [Longispora fulva]|uniref:GT2 family glycosyltransferase n=1 Tax=Longispora fulva TaxID=619741 RepID=A0A8J7GSX7_9ACTN|nr:glycosyltransferase [Longispora fulva]MBG6137743.1 GT2 family glycosyltransferase [Longispora fulva]GIG62101.1 glycosyl hydrolase [Longispora fulva]
MSSRPTPRLSVITVLYRSAEMLRETLPTWVASGQGLPVEYVFVNNTPDDGSLEVIRACLGDEGYRYLPDHTNPGFAGGCNRAVAAVDAGHVMLLNPDVWLHGDSLGLVLAAIDADPSSPVAVGMRMHGRSYVGIDLHPIGLFIDRPADLGRGPLGPSGGAAVLPRELFERTGGFDEPMFAWGEDADLAFRMYAAGVRTRTLDLDLPHAWGHSVEGDSGLGEFRAFLLARNRLLVAWRNFSVPLMAVMLPLLVLTHLALAVRKARQGLLGAFLKGVGHGLAQGPRARRRRTGRRFGFRLLRTYLSAGRSAS